MKKYLLALAVLLAVTPAFAGNGNPSGPGITSLTGDGTASGTGSVPFTLSTVNSNVGSFGSGSSIPSFTVNGKGLIIAATSTPVAIGTANITGLSPSSYIDTTNASNITSGTLSAARIPTLNQSTTGQAGTVATINGLISNGTNVTITGSGTSGSPYVINSSGGGGMTYPGAGVANSTGSAWGTSYTVGTGANNLVQLNGSSQLPAVSGVNLTGMLVSQITGAAPLASPTFTGTVTLPIGTGAVQAANGVVSVISNTGSGNNVLATSPVLVTPNLGTPSAVVLTNATGTASGLTAGTVTTNANLTGDVTSIGNATTLATVNSNTGSWGSASAVPVFTVNGKGLITAVANTNIAIGTSGVTGLSAVAWTGAYSSLSGTPTLGSLAALSSIGTSQMNATGTANSTTYLRGDNTWGTAGGGTPGGSNGQIQYNNGGAFAGAGTNAFINANGLYGSYLFSGANYFAFGDSITGGTGASTAPNRFTNLISADTASVLTNYGNNGAQACDTTLKAFQYGLPNLKSKTFYTHMDGTNDATYKGTGAYETGVYIPCSQAILTWLSIPAEYKTYAQACTLAGTWTADTTPQTGIGETSSTNGSTATCSIKSFGGPIYLWYLANDASGGTFTYSVDGGSNTSVTVATTPAIATNLLAGTTGYIGIRIPSIAAGTHSVVVTVTSSTNASNSVDFWGVGTVPSLSYSANTAVAAMGVMRFLNDTSPTVTAAYNTDALTLAATLKADGLPIIPVDVRPYFDALCPGATAYCMYDSVHPNDKGHEYLREAVEGITQMPRATVPTTLVNGVTYINSNTANSIGSPPGSLYPGYLVGSVGSYNMGMDPGSVSFGGSNFYYATKVFGPSVALGNMNTTVPTSQSSFSPMLVAVSSALSGTGAVGIGTTFPYSKLDVSGNLSVGTTAAYFNVAAPVGGAIVQGSVGIGTNSPRNSAALDVNGSINIGSSTLLTSSTTLTNGAGSSAGTLTNAPAVGNPTKWIPINDNGTTRYIPAW